MGRRAGVTRAARLGADRADRQMTAQTMPVPRRTPARGVALRLRVPVAILAEVHQVAGHAARAVETHVQAVALHPEELVVVLWRLLLVTF